MTHRERVRAAIDHQPTDRTPLDFGGCGTTSMYFTAYENLKRQLGLEFKTVIGRRNMRSVNIDETILRRFDVDTRFLGLDAYDGPGHQCELEEEGFVDECGGVWSKVGDGPYLNVDGPFYGRDANLVDLDNHLWPDPDHPSYVRGLRDRALALRERSDCAIILNLPAGIVHTGQWLRGYDTWLKDLYKNRDYLCRLTDRIADWWVRVSENALDEVGDLVDVVHFGDDLGTQQSTLFDPAIYREIIKPRHARMIAALKGRTDAKVLLHSCGAVSAVFDDFIDIGVDAINPVQVGAAGMAPERLKSKWGDRLAFWGAVDTQQVLPFGTPDEVRAEVRRLIDVLGAGGGYVVNSVHNIQPDVPPENVVAMLEEAVTYGST